jgi:hypothetical protein
VTGHERDDREGQRDHEATDRQRRNAPGRPTASGSVRHLMAIAPRISLHAPTLGPQSVARQRLDLPRQSQPVDATILASASGGFIQPGVCRGRPLRWRATLPRARWSWTERSVPFGKYCRSSPLVFSLLARCQGCAGRRSSPERRHQGAVAGPDREPALRPASRALAPGKRCERDAGRHTMNPSCKMGNA